MDYAYKITTHGRAAIAACMALEEPFRIARVAFGGGRIDESAELADVHELLEYVSEGAVAERRHRDGRLFLTIQYVNSEHPEVPDFLLSEFIVYVQDPESGEETDLLYGTLGDYRQPVPAWNRAYPPSVFNFPLEIILSSELTVQNAAPAGLVTWDDLERWEGGAVGKHNADPEAHPDLRREVEALLAELDGGMVKVRRVDLMIPAEGWEAGSGADYPLRLDLPVAEAAENLVPILTIPPGSLAAASACGLCPAAETRDGSLRLHAKAAPAEDIPASLVLLENVRREQITIPAEGWSQGGEPGAAYPLYVDIPDPAITDDLTPVVAILPEFLAAAAACGLSPSARTLSGALRLYARDAPASPLRAGLALLRNAEGGRTLPVVTEDDLDALLT